MILKFFVYLKISFGLTLLLAAVSGDVIYIWFENNMAEEYLIIVSVVFMILTVAKMKQHKFLK